MNTTAQRPLPARSTLLICTAIVVLGLLLVLFIFNTEPKAEREAATRKAPMPVEVVKADYGTFQPTITAMGTVYADEDLQLRPRVAGQIIERAQHFVPGGYAKKGDMLLRIDPADYNHALALRRSELVKAQTALKLEQGNQSIAAADYKQLAKNLDPLQRSLVLREPQLQAAEAAVDAARINLAQAQLEVDRTTIRAPFDAQILSREVSVGAQVSQGDTLAHLVGLQSYWVEATVPSDKVRWLPQSNSAKVTVRRRDWPQHTQRVGELRSVVGALDPKTRMARVLIEVTDPLALTNNNELALAVGSYVECALPARTLTNVVKLNRDYLRKGDTTWVLENNTLSIRKLEILFLDADYAYIGDGLGERDMIVTTSLSSIKEGAELQLKASADAVGVNNHE